MGVETPISQSRPTNILFQQGLPTMRKGMKLAKRGLLTTFEPETLQIWNLIGRPSDWNCPKTGQFQSRPTTNKKTSKSGGFVPKERFELSRARCPLRPERSASASSATSASEFLFYRKGVICQIKSGIWGICVKNRGEEPQDNKRIGSTMVGRPRANFSSPDPFFNQETELMGFPALAWKL